jgi:hypothetical protein
MAEQLGQRFAAAVAAKDVTALESILRPEVDFRGLTPGREWSAASSAEFIQQVLLGSWFEPSDEIQELVAVQTGTVADTQRVGYRLRVHNADGEHLVEQQAYYRERDGQIGWLRILCSGYRPASPA